MGRTVTKSIAIIGEGVSPSLAKEKRNGSISIL